MRGQRMHRSVLRLHRINHHQVRLDYFVIIAGRITYRIGAFWHRLNTYYASIIQKDFYTRRFFVICDYSEE
jgi:hypothetical protein